MPERSQILEGLSAIANQQAHLAIAWHVILLVLLVALLLGWRPTRRTAGVALALPLLSVGLLAWYHANPFNGSVFLALALLLAMLGLRLPSRQIASGPRFALLAGALLVGFGWIYPHFLQTDHPWAYLYAAPAGLIPCPTLSITIGLALMAGGLGSRAWDLSLASAGLFYALFGALLLQVWIDGLLAAGSAGLGVLALRGRA
jgi:hypothetical protein